MRVIYHIGKSDAGWCFKFPVDQAIAPLGEWLLKRLQSGHALDQQSAPVDQIKTAARFRHGQPGIDNGTRNKCAYASPRRACPEYRNTLFSEGNAGDIYRAKQSPNRDGSSSLNVVVEGAQLITVFRQQPIGVTDRKILPMQKYVRPSLAHSINETLNEVIIFKASDPPVSPADIEWISEEFLIVGANIQEDRQRCRGMQASASGIKR